jgi:4-hydroxy-3-methylbut-2-enyl diphosphate reductase
MGVRRAVDLAVKEARNAAANGKVYTLGPLIHNRRVLDELKSLGINSISNRTFGSEQLENSKEKRINCSIIIRAHGISPELEDKIRDSGCRVVDATCPKVKANQLKTQELSSSGYCLFLAGEAEHAEITGLLGYAASAPFCVVTGTVQEAKKKACELYKKNKHGLTALLGQTTISEDEYKAIGNEIKKLFPNLEIINTICTATHERQTALREILDKVDAVIVAGTEESANTRRLLVIAKKSGKPCIIAEKPSAIPKEFFTYETVGLCSGASTPDSVVDEIEIALQYKKCSLI